MLHGKWILVLHQTYTLLLVNNSDHFVILSIKEFPDILNSSVTILVHLKITIYTFLYRNFFLSTLVKRVKYMVLLHWITVAISII